MKLIDVLYPKIKISLLIVEGAFGPGLVEWLSIGEEQRGAKEEGGSRGAKDESGARVVKNKIEARGAKRGARAELGVGSSDNP